MMSLSYLQFREKETERDGDRDTEKSRGRDMETDRERLYFKIL